ncbi:MAG: translocation/assembly module TamB, partial [Pseudophaeobacter sp.]
MRSRSPLPATLLLSTTLATSAMAQEDATEPSYLESFLEETLSGDNQFIEVTRLTGAFSSQASIDQITVADADGIWLELTGAQLDWNRLALLTGAFSVNHLKAAEIKVLRAPKALPQDPSLPAPEATPFELPELPVSIELGEIKIDRISLAEPLFGFAATLNLAGDLKLAEGSLATQLKVNRLDKPGDRLLLAAGYANASRQIDLSLELDEAAGGLLSSALSLPGAPSLQLNVAGSGPVEDFEARIALASNGEERLAGAVVLKALAQPTATEAEPSEGAVPSTQAIAFSADLGGDIDVLLQPDYRPFFGPDLQMTLRGSTAAGLGLTLDSFALRTRALRLSGALAMTNGGQLDTANIRAGITPPDGVAAVTLPLAGANTTLGRAEVLAQKVSDGPWAVSAELRQLSHPQALIAAGSITAKGLLNQETGLPLQLDGKIQADLKGFHLRDPALAAATGSEISLTTGLTSEGPGALQLTNLLVQGDDYQASGDLVLEGLQAGLKASGDLRLGAANMARFSDLAGQPLSGAIQAQIKGSVTPLSGAFYADLALQGQGLSAGIAELDRLTEGNLSLSFTGGRSQSGLEVERFQLISGQISAEASGNLNSQAGALTLQAQLKDLGVLLPDSPGLAGGLQLTGDVARDKDSFSGNLRPNGPNSSFADLSGDVQLDGDADLTFEATLAELQRFLPELPGKVTALGQAQRRNAHWQVSADAKAPAGAEAHLAGTFDETSGLADINAKGQ